jgi:hypothetical protein
MKILQWSFAKCVRELATVSRAEIHQALLSQFFSFSRVFTFISASQRQRQRFKVGESQPRLLMSARK